MFQWGVIKLSLNFSANKVNTAVLIVICKINILTENSQ